MLINLHLCLWLNVSCIYWSFAALHLWIIPWCHLAIFYCDVSLFYVKIIFICRKVLQIIHAATASIFPFSICLFFNLFLDFVDILVGCFCFNITTGSIFFFLIFVSVLNPVSNVFLWFFSYFMTISQLFIPPGIYLGMCKGLGTGENYTRLILM